METSAAVKSSTTAMKAAATVKCVSSAEAAAKAATVAVAATREAATVISSASPTAAIEASTVISATPISPVPRPGSDEEATGKPVRPIEAIGSAGVWVVTVVAIGANRRSAVVAKPRTDPHAYRYLRLRICCGNRQQRQQSEVPEILHFSTVRFSTYRRTQRKEPIRPYL
jgi:hypothetical protein